MISQPAFARSILFIKDAKKSTVVKVFFDVTCPKIGRQI
jgi:hypothetical protein